jgi:hypothetical protein
MSTLRCGRAARAPYVVAPAIPGALASCRLTHQGTQTIDLFNGLLLLDYERYEHTPVRTEVRIASGKRAYVWLRCAQRIRTASGALCNYWLLEDAGVVAGR